jgi:uncharacterized membrane protein
MSQPPDYPGTPEDPYGGRPGGYPPPPNYGSPPQPPNYGSPPPPPNYGAPQPPPGYGSPGGPPPAGPGRHSASPEYGSPPPPPGYGTPPPPPSYDQPSSGGYDQPSSGGYGQPSSGGYPPQQPGYGAPAGGGAPGGAAPAQLNIGEAISWAWNKFTKNIAPLVVPIVIYVAIVGVLYGVGFGIAIATGNNSTYTDEYGYQHANSSFSVIGLAALGVAYIGIFAVLIYMQASLISGSLDIADGKPVSIGTFFKPRNVGPVIITGLLVGLGAAVGSVLCIIPGIIFGFVSLFALHFAIDRSLSPVDAIKASIALVRANLVPTLLAWLVAGAVAAVGELACGVGVFASIPVAILIQVYAYRKLSGGQVVPVEQQGAYPSGPPAGLPPGYPPQQGYQQG